MFGEDGEGEVVGLGGGVGGAEMGEFIRRGEEFADGGLCGPDDELAECELVGVGDFDEGVVVSEEFGEESCGVDGDFVDLGVDGLGQDFVGG